MKKKLVIILVCAAIAFGVSLSTPSDANACFGRGLPLGHLIVC